MAPFPASVGPVAFVLKGYPRLSETFIAREILGLERRGLPIWLYSLRRPTDRAIHSVHREIIAPVAYLPEYLHEAPIRVLHGWMKARRLPGYPAARAAWLADLRRDRSRNRVRRFGQALVLAAEMPAEIAWLHAHFLHTPASVTRYAALMRRLPWSVSAHAKDVWTTPEWELREKLVGCRWLVTCTAAGAVQLSRLSSWPAKVELIYHGLDFNRFPPPEDDGSNDGGADDAGPDDARPGRDGSDDEDPVIVLSVGRAVSKKGLDVLLDALHRLPAGLHWRLAHIGGGVLSEQLKRHARDLGLVSRIGWLGAQPQDHVLDAYRAADLFVLPCRVGADGDRDGLPNVLMEAQSQNLPCISTNLSGIPELIVDGVTGLLVPPDDAEALAKAVCRLIVSPDLRRRLGRAGGQRVRAHFGQEAGLARLASKFNLTSKFNLDGSAAEPGDSSTGDDGNAGAVAPIPDKGRCASPSTHR